MYESSIVQHFTERAIRQTQRQQSIEYILEILGIRFDPNAAEALKPAIETIEDVQNLKQLHRSAVQSLPRLIGALSLDQFRQTLASITNGK
jgi:hypothetical protein